MGHGEGFGEVQQKALRAVYTGTALELHGESQREGQLKSDILAPPTKLRRSPR